MKKNNVWHVFSQKKSCSFMVVQCHAVDTIFFFFKRHSLGKCPFCCLLPSKLQWNSKNIYGPGSCMPQVQHTHIVPTDIALKHSQSFSLTRLVIMIVLFFFFLEMVPHILEFEKQSCSMLAHKMGGMGGGNTLKCTYDHLVIIKFLSPKVLK